MNQPPDGWVLLKDGASKVAAQRLADTNQLTTTAIVQFHEDAVTQIESLQDAQSERGLGLEMFKALTDVLMVAFPEEIIIEKVAGEALKAFRDTMIEKVKEQEQATAAHTLEHAKDQLRHVLDDLVAGARAGAQAGWAAGAYKVDESLNAFFNAHPQYKHLPMDADASVYEQWVCDQIGIRDAHVDNPAYHITGALWARFKTDLARASYDMQQQHVPVSDRMGFDFAHWLLNMDKHEKVQALAKMDEPRRSEFLHSGGFNDGLAEDEITAWLHLTKLWADPTSRSFAETELLMLP